MKFLSVLYLAATALPLLVKADYQWEDIPNLPAKTDPEHGQFGYNDCQKRYGASSTKGHCQNVWAPHKTDKIGNSEARTISYCMKSGYGTRLIPDGTITGAHFLKTPSYVQVTGRGHLKNINIEVGDQGGELDPHGANGSGNPVGGLVYTRAYTGEYERIYQWNNFMSYNEFCFRGCRRDTPNDSEWCPHIYDVMGCMWNQPANYDHGFEQCEGTEGEWPGVYSGSTWYQGQNPTPPAQTAGKSSKCKSHATIATGKAIKVPGK